jgi:hypothetical protein
MDRDQHKRYLLYLERYEYFGRGTERLDGNSFAALDTEYRRLASATDLARSERDRRRELARQLLRD